MSLPASSLSSVATATLGVAVLGFAYVALAAWRRWSERIYLHSGTGRLKEAAKLLANGCVRLLSFPRGPNGQRRARAQMAAHATLFNVI